MAFTSIQPFQYVAIRLPSDQLQVERLIPNTVINLGKYGSFRTNQILGRPYHLTYEILDRSEVQNGRELRIVPAAELHAVELVEQGETDGVSTPRTDGDETGVSTPQQQQSKSNVNTRDDPQNQKLTMAEIEALKQSASGSGRELVDKIMQSHTTLDQKTAFSLAKYTLRKHKKYLKRFTVLPLDVSTLVDCIFADREHAKIMEIRHEHVGLVGCWANILAAGEDELLLPNVSSSSRYMLVDDTGGLLVAAMAERMDILHPTNFEVETTQSSEDNEDDEEEKTASVQARKSRQQKKLPSPMSATSNTITLVHANQQPNLGLLRYFNYDSNSPNTSHPLYTHLKTVSWLQVLEPSSDITYQEPATIPDTELAKLRSNKRSAYFRKRKRWERVRSIVDETRAGAFNGLIVASFTNPTSILRHLVPLLAGGSQVVVYSPNIEPLTEVADWYSTARRTTFLNTPPEERTVPSKNFPVDPTLLLAPMVQTARVRRWQVLPGRTHPLMTGRGGAEGYVFVATRVIPVVGKVEARGRPPRGRKVKAEETNGLEAQKAAIRAPVEEEEDVDILGSPEKKRKVGEDNERDAQRAAEREYNREMNGEESDPDGESLGGVQLVDQESSDEMPVLGPATEALNQKNAEDRDVQMSIED